MEFGTRLATAKDRKEKLQEKSEKAKKEISQNLKQELKEEEFKIMKSCFGEIIDSSVRVAEKMIDSYAKFLIGFKARETEKIEGSPNETKMLKALSITLQDVKMSLEPEERIEEIYKTTSKLIEELVEDSKNI
ncbi:MAG: hypothetical protein ABEI53_02090 [Candidatus Magasanikbacteria bacterium]